MISDSLLGELLVTNKHVVQDTFGQYVDSIFVRYNKMLANEQVVSDTNEFVLYLKKNGNAYFVEHPNKNVDLVMIPCLSFNTNKRSGGVVAGLFSNRILSKERLTKLGIDEGTEIEIIGFSLSSSLLSFRKVIHYHFHRYGKVGLFTTEKFTLLIDGALKTADFILLDMTIRPGDSGSPIFAHIEDKTYLVGFISAVSTHQEFGIGYPVYYLYDLIAEMKDLLRNEK